MGTYIKGFIGIIILLFLVTFGVKNSQTVPVSYYYELINLQAPLYGVVYLCLFIGIVIGMIIGLSSRWTLKRQIKSVEKENRELLDEVKKMEEMKGKEEEVHDEG